MTYRSSVYSEDHKHTSGDWGTFVLAVRNDGLVALAADGDYIPLTVDSEGRLHATAKVTESALPDGAATAAKQDVAITSLQKIDDVQNALMSVGTDVFSNYMSEIALGNVPNRSCVNKFGHAPSGIQTVQTDIWDRSDASATQPVWLAPTAARIHTIASTSIQDDTNGSGVNTVIVSYLPDWDTAETTETVTGDLNTGIVMNNAAVIIHRMKVVPQATTTSVGGNAGTITATAATDATITALILPGNGQTEMAIYGIPSTQTALLHSWYVQIDKAQGAAASADFELRLNPNPDVQTVAFLRKGDISLQSTGASVHARSFVPPIKFVGPAILKVTGSASANDVDGEAGFNMEIVTN